MYGRAETQPRPGVDGRSALSVQVNGPLRRGSKPRARNEGNQAAVSVLPQGEVRSEATNPARFGAFSENPARAQKAVKRFRDKWPNAILIHTPVHASWLNQFEIYFSIVQRKVLTPNDFSSVAELEQRLLAFQCHYERTASPFKWAFPRSQLHTLLAKIAAKQLALAA